MCSSFDGALARLHLKHHFHRRHDAVVSFWFEEDGLQASSGERSVTIRENVSCPLEISFLMSVDPLKSLL